MGEGKWVTIRGHRVFIKDKATNDYMNNFIRGGKDIKVYRAGSDIGELESGTFCATNMTDANNYGEAKEFVIDKNANLYKGNNTREYAKNNNLLNVKDNMLKEKLGVETLKEVTDIYENWTPNSYLNKNPNLYFFAYQYMAKKDLEKKGFDGALWKWEDDLTPEQYQIWNEKVLKRK